MTEADFEREFELELSQSGVEGEDADSDYDAWLHDRSEALRRSVERASPAHDAAASAWLELGESSQWVTSNLDAMSAMAQKALVSASVSATNPAVLPRTCCERTPPFPSTGTYQSPYLQLDEEARKIVNDCLQAIVAAVITLHSGPTQRQTTETTDSHSQLLKRRDLSKEIEALRVADALVARERLQTDREAARRAAAAERERVEAAAAAKAARAREAAREQAEAENRALLRAMAEAESLERVRQAKDSAARELVALRRARHVRTSAAAVTVQAVWRRCVAQWHTRRLRARQWAATRAAVVIQQLARLKRAVGRAREARAERAEAMLAAERAAVLAEKVAAARRVADAERAVQEALAAERARAEFLEATRQRAVRDEQAAAKAAKAAADLQWRSTLDEWRRGEPSRDAAWAMGRPARLASAERARAAELESLTFGAAMGCGEGLEGFEVLDAVDASTALFGDPEPPLTAPTALTASARAEASAVALTAAAVGAAGTAASGADEDEDPRAAVRRMLAEADARRLMMLAPAAAEAEADRRPWRGPSRAARAAAAAVEAQEHLARMPIEVVDSSERFNGSEAANGLTAGTTPPCNSKRPPPSPPPPKPPRSPTSTLLSRAREGVAAAVAALGLGSDLGGVVSLGLDVEGLSGGLDILADLAPRLLALSANVNKLSDLTFAGVGSLAHLRELSLRDNGIRVLAGLAGLQRLESLAVDVNTLQRLDAQQLNALPALQRLCVAANHVDDWPSDASPGGGLDLPHLVHLEAFHNRLAFLPQRALFGLPCLTHLDLARNRLEVIDGAALSEAKALTTLVLSQNRLKAPPRLRLPLLRRLGLASNRIATLTAWAGLPDDQAAAATWLPSLETLDLGDNLLAHLGRGVFVGAPLLRSLDLSFNGLAGPVGDPLGSLVGLFSPRSSADRLVAIALRDNPIAVHLAVLDSPLAPTLPRAAAAGGAAGDAAIPPTPPLLLGTGNADNATMPATTPATMPATLPATAAPTAAAHDPGPLHREWESPLVTGLCRRLPSLRTIDGRALGPARRALACADDRMALALDDESDRPGVARRPGSRALVAMDAATQQAVEALWKQRPWKCAACGGLLGATTTASRTTGGGGTGSGTVSGGGGDIAVGQSGGEGIAEEKDVVRCRQCDSRHKLPPAPRLAAPQPRRRPRSTPSNGSPPRLDDERYDALEMAAWEGRRRADAQRMRHAAEDAADGPEVLGDDSAPGDGGHDEGRWSGAVGPCRRLARRSRHAKEWAALAADCLKDHVDPRRWRPAVDPLVAARGMADDRSAQAAAVAAQRAVKARADAEATAAATEAAAVAAAAAATAALGAAAGRLQAWWRAVRVRAWWRGGGQRRLQILRRAVAGGCVLVQAVARGAKVRRSLAAALAASLFHDAELDGLLSSDGLDDVGAFLRSVGPTDGGSGSREGKSSGGGGGGSGLVLPPVVVIGWAEKRRALHAQARLDAAALATTHGPRTTAGTPPVAVPSTSSVREAPRLSAAAADWSAYDDLGPSASRPTSTQSSASAASGHWPQPRASPITRTHAARPTSASSSTPRLPALSTAALAAAAQRVSPEAKAVMAEWGLGDPSVALAVLARREAMLKGELEAQRRERDADPAYRFRKLMHNVQAHDLAQAAKASAPNKNSAKVTSSTSSGGSTVAWGSAGAAVVRDRANHKKKAPTRIPAWARTAAEGSVEEG